MAHPGHYSNPVTLKHPGDLERATRHTARPSEAQAAADNYKMAHVKVGPLAISIETPKDHIRRGVDPHGARWHVHMPADYGYIKRTVDHDNDPVDVYLGPDSHVAENLPVWVVDQRHAHNHAFDEHKCMVGFPNSAMAHRTYLAGFSDGKGQERIGACTQMSFGEFVFWLKNGNTKKPLAYHPPSASVKSDSGFNATRTTCPCTACQGLHGGKMTTPATTPASDPKALGLVTSLMSRVFKNLTPADADTLVKEASLMATAEIGKATDAILATGHDGTRVGHVDDLWSGRADGAVAVVHAHGPGSKAGSDKVPVGPAQDASGDGAEKMEREYSRVAGQSGVQAATEKLGRELMNHSAAMKSIVNAVELQGQAISAIAAKAGAPDEAAIKSMVTAAVSEGIKAALPKLVSKAVADAVKNIVLKAEEHEEHEEEDHEKAAAKAAAEESESEKEDEGDKEEESGSGTEIEITNELEEEDEDEGEDEAAKSRLADAARYRLRAKSRVRKADRCLAKAKKYGADAKFASAVKSLRRAAKNHLRFAKGYISVSQSLRHGLGKSSVSVLNAIAASNAVRKALPAAQSENQTKWATSETQKVGKAVDTAAQADLAKAVETIRQAANGMGMLQTTVADLVAAVSNQTVATAHHDNGTTERLPPVFALAKAGGDAVQLMEKRIIALRDSNDVTFQDADTALDIVMNVRMGLPEEMVKAKINRLHSEKLQQLLLAA